MNNVNIDNITDDIDLILEDPAKFSAIILSNENSSIVLNKVNIINIDRK